MVTLARCGYMYAAEFEKNIVWFGFFFFFVGWLVVCCTSFRVLRMYLVQWTRRNTKNGAISRDPKVSRHARGNSTRNPSLLDLLDRLSMRLVSTTEWTILGIEPLNFAQATVRLCLCVLPLCVCVCVCLCGVAWRGMVW
jgi:hypothetical protein